MITTIALIQARVGSTRLPGKVMYPLDGRPALAHVVERTTRADRVSDVVVATSTAPPDDVIAQYAPSFGAEVVRGSESNVLSRFERAVAEYDPDVVVRITGDCPLIDPATIDHVVSSLENANADYASNIIQRTFPRGLDVEAFTTESFERVISAATTSAEREHVTPYYHENPDEFDRVNLTSDQVFEKDQYRCRTDLRLTLDEPDDYRLLDRIYDIAEYETILPIRSAIDIVDQHNLTELNAAVEQKTV